MKLNRDQAGKMKPGRASCRVYIGGVTALGAGAVMLSAYRIVLEGVSYHWLILAYLAVLTGAFTVRIPRMNSKFSVSDTFIFLNTILFGTAAGVLTGALDGLVGSVRSRTAARRKQTIPFNTGVLALSVFAASEVFFKTFGKGPLSSGASVSIAEIALPLLLSGSVYYLCNSLLVALMLSLDNGQSAIRMWLRSLHVTSVVTFAGAAAGALLAFAIRSITPLTLLAVVPILVVFYYVNMIYMRPGKVPEAPADANSMSVVHRPAYKRFHYFMVALGLGFAVLLCYSMLSAKISYTWLIVAALGVVTGFITVKVPGIKIKFTLADTFVFANTILFGPVVGGITAALDGLAGSVRCRSRSRRWEFMLFNVAGMTLSAYLAGRLFYWMLGHDPVYRDQAAGIEEFFLPTLVLATSYHLLNSMCVAGIIALQMKGKILRVWRENLLWGMTAEVACALGAVFVSAAIVSVTPIISLAVLLSLVIVYVSLRANAERVPHNLGALE
jgi:uncharacterized membrane protein